MASSPQFINTGVVASVNVASANTALDGTGTITQLVSGASGGTRILEIVAKCAVTSVAAQVGIFISTDSGSTWRLFDQLTIGAATVSTSVASNRVSRSYTNLVLADATQRLGVTTTISQSTNVIALGGNFV